MPWALTVEKFELDGEIIDNPFRSFTLNAPIVDQMASTDPAGADYSKPLGYVTVRYPLSGLVGPSDKAATDKHNAQWPSVQGQIEALDTNIKNWLGASITVNGKVISTTVADLYELCLDAPNYTVFSNTTSATQWSKDHGAKVVALEQPHNDIRASRCGVDDQSYEPSRRGRPTLAIWLASPSYSPGCRKEPGKLRVGVDARLRVAARLPRGVIGVVGAGGLREGLGRGDSGPAVYGPAGISAAAM